MSLHPLVLLLLIAIAACCPSLALAQASPAPASAREATWEIQPYVGVARHSPAGPDLGLTPDRNHVFLGIHVTGVLVRWRGFTLCYAPEIVPLLLLSDTPTFHTVAPPDPSEMPRIVVDGSRAVAGVGGSPVGFEARLNLGSRVRVYTATAAGVVLFTRAAPVPDARPFNFTFEFGGGADVRLQSRWWLRVGYKFHHLSNANSAPENPGVDANVIMVGLSRALGRR